MVLFPDAGLPLVAALWAPTPTPTATCRGWGTAAVLCSAAPLPVLAIVGLDGLWARVAHHAQIRPLPARKQQGFGHKA